MPNGRADDICVVIPMRHRRPTLDDALQALERQTTAAGEIVVVMGGGRETLTGNVRFVLDDGGPGAARNAGANATARPIVLFLGHNTIPGPRLVEHHLAAHDRHPEIEAVVLGRMALHPDIERDRLARWMARSGITFDDRDQPDGPVSFDRFHSSNASLKRAFLLANDGFDETNDYSFDLDCARRLHNAGMRLVQERGALAYHRHPLGWKHATQRVQHAVHGEWLITAAHSSFEPSLLNRCRRAVRRTGASRVWPFVSHVLRTPGPLQRAIDRRADRWYLERLAPYAVDAWEGARDLHELRAYLGPAYDPTRFVDHVGELTRELDAMGDTALLYRTSESYLYDLTAFALSGVKVPYLQELRRLVPPPARVLDWGAGIGSDGLRLLGEGYDVAFADFDNPSTRFLRWRLQHRGAIASVYDIDRDEAPSGFDVAFAFDVIEHVPDPFATLSELERRAAIVMINLLEHDISDPYPHHQLPIDAILAHAEARGVVAYGLYHGRSHFVAYRGEGASVTPLRRRRSRASQG